MIGKQEFQYRLSKPGQFRTIGGDLHSGLAWRGAGGQRHRPAFDFDQTEPAAPMGFQPFVIAEGWDIDSSVLADIKDRFPLLEMNIHSVNLHHDQFIHCINLRFLIRYTFLIPL